MLSRRFIAARLAELGIITTDSIDAQIRNDAGETASFTRALEFIQAEVYRILYPDLRLLDFVPLDTSVPAGADTFTIRIWDWFGQARIIANYAADLPMVGLLAAEKAQLIKSLGVGFDYSQQDIAGAAFSGVPLEVEKAGAARRAHENKIETVGAFGDAAAGLPGFVNHPNVTVISAPGPIAGNWDTADADTILEELHYVANTTAENTNDILPPDTLVLPSNRFKRLATLRMSEFDSTPVLKAFLAASPYIKNIDQWPLLKLADAAGTGPRALCYKRDKQVVKVVVPRPFTMLPPQVKNLSFVVPCWSRYGGVVWGHPLAGTYVDGI